MLLLHATARRHARRCSAAAQRACFSAMAASSSFLGSSLRRSAVGAAPRAPASRGAAPLRVVAHYGNRVNMGGGKPWERTEVNSNGKPVKINMHVKTGDVVQVRTLAAAPDVCVSLSGRILCWLACVQAAAAVVVGCRSSLARTRAPLLRLRRSSPLVALWW